MENKLPRTICNKHLKIIYKCFENTCTYSNICQECTFFSKEDLFHYYSHFDFIKPLKNFSDIKSKLKQGEAFTNINKLVLDFIEKLQDIVDNTFYEALSKRENIKLLISDSVFENYEMLTSSMRDFSVKELMELNKKIDEFLEKVGNKEKLREKFENYIEKLKTSLIQLKLQNFLPNPSTNNDLSINNVSNNLVQVFGNGLGNAIASSEQDLYKATQVINKNIRMNHWNAGVTDKAWISLELITKSIVKNIKIAVRSSEFISITGIDEGESSIELVKRMITCKPTNAMYSPDCLISLNITNETPFNKIILNCENGTNVSLFWVEVFGFIISN